MNKYELFLARGYLILFLGQIAAFSLSLQDAPDCKDVGAVAHRVLPAPSCLQDVFVALDYRLFQAPVDFRFSPVLAVKVLQPLEIAHAHPAAVGKNVGNNRNAFCVQDIVACAVNRPDC